MNPSGSPADYLAAFIGGVFVSFTPCVYPLIPISAGYIGVISKGSRLRGLILSLVYVTGVAITYSGLGLFASLSGTFFGKISSHPATYFFVGAVIIFFGLSMLDLFNITAVSLVKQPVFKKQGYLSTFILGLSSGLVASTCLTPVLGSILVYLAAKKNLVYGAALLLSFAYGMGLILVLAGTFSSILASLPKSGKWTACIKKINGLVLLGTGAYFIFTAIRRM